MRTKHLLTAIMLPALFAACTNDDFTEIGHETAQGGRKVVGNVTLTVEDGVDTRLAYGANGYTWEAGDQLGACLMDEIDATDYNNPLKRWSERFDLVDYIQTNYKFTRDANANWNTEAKLLEGNYFMVYPYNAKQGVRNAYEFDATSQAVTGTDKASLLKAYTKNNGFVGYAKIEKSDKDKESVAVKMVPVFGATGITINKVGTGTYKIEKIVLRGTKVHDKAIVKPATSCTTATQYNDNGASTAGISAINGYVADGFNVAQYTADNAEFGFNNNGTWTGGLYNPAWDAYDGTAAMKDVLDYGYSLSTTGKIEVSIASGNTLTSTESVNVIVMVRPMSLTSAADEAVLDIYTDKGMIRGIQLNTKYDGEAAAPGTIDANNVTTDHALTEIGAGATNAITVKFDDTSVNPLKDLDIYNESDLASLIHWNTNISDAVLTADLKNDVTVTKAMADELLASKIKSITLNGAKNVTIAADAPAATMDKFTYSTSVTNIIVAGTQNMTKNAGTPIRIDGTLNITADMKGTNKVTANITNNYGTLNVKADVELNSSVSITNIGAMTIAAGKNVTVGTVTNGNGYDWGTGSIENAGKIAVLVNTAYSTVNNAATGVIGENVNVGSIANGTNAGTINNNDGKVYIMTNTGRIYANGKSTTRVKDNASSSINGNLIITKLDSDDGNIAFPTAGNIVQEIAKDANTDAVDVRANTIWLSASLKVEKKDKDGNFVNVDLTAPSFVNGAVTVVATGANARIDGNYKELSIQAIEVWADAALVLNKITAIIATNTSVAMGGYANSHKAVLTINSNAALHTKTTGKEAITASGTPAFNTVNNESSNTDVITVTAP